ncbi:MAG: toll/interleukin-1 receptor domain-containing protein [Anaerolineales bacterium]|nr:toll/interleukin-1 receptor domain-containing protein [Anaerolineales bacterium]
MTRVFISHSSKDKALARRIASGLRQYGIDVWLDEWEIVVGHSITQKIQEGLGDCRFLALILTKHSIKSGWVEKEWQSRIGEEATNKRVSILPILADDCEIPILLRDKKYADFTKDFGIGFFTLLNSVRVLSLPWKNKSTENTKTIEHEDFLSEPKYDLVSLSIDWMKDQLKDREWVLPLCSPKKLDLTIIEILQKELGAWYALSVQRFPWGPTLKIQPDIIGAVKLKQTEICGWVVGMVHPHMMFEYDVIRSRHYIDMTDAFNGYVFWDMHKGFSPDGLGMLNMYSTPYRGITDSGEADWKNISYVMYDSEFNSFDTDLEGSIIRSACRITETLYLNQAIDDLSK